MSGFFAVFLAAAVLGDTVNYEIGKRVGSAASTGKGWFGRLINRDKLRQAEAFFDKHGGKTIAIARFMPLIRTFAHSFPVVPVCTMVSSSTTIYLAVSYGLPYACSAASISVM